MKKILLMIMSLFLITGCSSKVDNIKTISVNNNEEIIKEQQVGDLKITSATLMYDGGISTFNIDVTNTGENIINISKFDILFKANSDNVITTLDGYSFSTINPNETLNISVSSDIDLSDAKLVEYIIN